MRNGRLMARASGWTCALALASLAGACDASPTGPGGSQGSTVRAGTWGGTGIGLQVSAGGGAAVEYDCAHGTIDREIALDAQGRFTVRGQHVTERPGPVREGETLPAQPASYTGTVSGDTMRFTVALTETGQVLGTFTLTFGRPPIVRKCL
jgi:hypothetical protein